MTRQIERDATGARWTEARHIHDAIWPANNRGWWDRGLERYEFLFVATEDEAVVGYLLGEFYSGWSIAHEVAIEPHRRGRGIARRLIRAWAVYSSSQDVDVLLVHPLPGPTWERLDAFYRSLGFSEPLIDDHLQADPAEVVTRIDPPSDS